MNGRESENWKRKELESIRGNWRGGDGLRGLIDGLHALMKE